MVIRSLIADDAVLDALGDEMSVVLVMTLAAWRLDVDAEPIPDFTDCLGVGGSGD